VRRTAMKFTMKKTLLLMICTFQLALGTPSINAQERQNKIIEATYLNGNEEPIVFKFEPDFLIKNKQRKAEIAGTKKRIDTLNISDRKRLKLLKDLYKKGVSKRLKKALSVEPKFDEVE